MIAKRWQLLIIITLCLLSYLPALFGGLIWDDEDFIVERPQIRTWEATRASLDEDIYGIYRPGRTVVYYATYQLFGATPWAYHILGMLLHAGVSVLLYLLFTRLSGQRIAFWASALFAAHPLHVERVANATGSFDLWGLLLMLGSLLLYVAWRRGTKHGHWWSLGLFTVGLFFTEEIWTLPLLFLAYDYIYHPKKDLHTFRAQKTTGISLAILALFLLLRFGILDITTRYGQYPGNNILIALISIPWFIASYLGLLLWPVSLSPFRAVTTVSVIVSLRFLSSLLFLGVLGWLVWKRRSSREILFGTLFMLVTLLPFLNLLPAQTIFAERFFYLPSAGVLLALVAALSRLPAKTFAGLLGLLLVLAVPLTMWQATFWHDTPSLMQRGIALNPQSSKAYNNLGTYYFRLDERNAARDLYVKAVDSDPANHRAWVNLGTLYSTAGFHNESVYAFTTALQLTPENWEAYDKLGWEYFRAGDENKALQSIATALQLNPRYVPAYGHLGVILAERGDTEQAIAAFENVVLLDPTNAEGYFNLGIIHERIGDLDTALSYYRQAAALDPNPLYLDKAR